MWVPARRLDPELMDAPDVSREEMQGALEDIRLVNRLLGGGRAMLSLLDVFLRETPPDRPLEILDVGTGGADIPLEMVAHARRRGRKIRVTALDCDRWVAAFAARATAGCPEIRIIRADAMSLPFSSGSFDIVTASMFLHHFDHRGVVRLFKSFRQIARRAVLVNDLRRHRLPWAFIGAISRVTRRNAMFCHDAPLSVLRGFTDDELVRAGREAGVVKPQVERRWPFRLVAVLPGSTVDERRDAAASVV